MEDAGRDKKIRLDIAAFVPNLPNEFVINFRFLQGKLIRRVGVAKVYSDRHDDSRTEVVRLLAKTNFVFGCSLFLSFYVFYIRILYIISLQ